MHILKIGIPVSVPYWEIEPGVWESWNQNAIQHSASWEKISIQFGRMLIPAQVVVCTDAKETLITLMLGDRNPLHKVRSISVGFEILEDAWSDDWKQRTVKLCVAHRGLHIQRPIHQPLHRASEGIRMTHRTFGQIIGGAIKSPADADNPVGSDAR